MGCVPGAGVGTRPGPPLAMDLGGQYPELFPDMQREINRSRRQHHHDGHPVESTSLPSDVGAGENRSRKIGDTSLVSIHSGRNPERVTDNSVMEGLIGATREGRMTRNLEACMTVPPETQTEAQTETQTSAPTPPLAKRSLPGRPCTRCRKHPRRAQGQRWCRFCHAAWEREHYVGSPRKDKLSASCRLSR